MAKIMEEEAEEEDENEDETRNENDTKGHAQDQPGETQGQTANFPAPKRRKHRRGASQFLADFANLLSSDFTRSLILVIEVGGMEDHMRLKEVPVRNKIDTGSDEDFVSRKLITKHGMDRNKIHDIPVERQKERTLHLLDNLTFTPKQEVTISWHKPQDARQRETTFLVVDCDLFDVLIGSKHWVDEAKQSMLFSLGRHRKEGNNSYCTSPGCLVIGSN